MKNYLIIGGCIFFMLACKTGTNDTDNTTLEANVNTETKSEESVVKFLQLSTVHLNAPFQMKTENVSVKREAALPKIEGDSTLNILVQNLAVDYYEGIMGANVSKHTRKPQERLKAAWEEQKKGVIDDTKGMESYKDNRVWEEHFSSSVVEYSSKYLVVTNTYNNYWGGAHGMYGTQYLIVDRDAKKVVNIDTIFADKEAAKKVIEKNLKIWLKKNDLKWSELQLEDGKYPLSSNFQLKGDSLIINHNVYEVGPYVMGEVEFGVPLKELKPYFQKDFQP